MATFVQGCLGLGGNDSATSTRQAFATRVFYPFFQEVNKRETIVDKKNSHCWRKMILMILSVILKPKARTQIPPLKPLLLILLLLFIITNKRIWLTIFLYIILIYQYYMLQKKKKEKTKKNPK